MTPFLWALRSLRRHPVRTALSLLGVAVAAAMLVDMVMLSGGMDESFSRMLLVRGWQIRVTPKGTLPFDTEATIGGAGPLLDSIRRAPHVAAAGGVLGGSLYAAPRSGDTLVALVGYGIDPRAQALYELETGRDIADRDSAGILLSRPAAEALGAGPGDTIEVSGALDPQVAGASVKRRLVARGIVRWLYDFRGQRSVGMLLPVMQALGPRGLSDPVSLVMVKVADDARVAEVAGQLRTRHPRLEVNSAAELVVAFRQRMVYFRQLSLILGTMSLIVAILLIATLLTITVNERLGEIATLRAIGVSRWHVVRQVLAEGTVLTLAGTGLGLLLGLVTARHLDTILTSFPGLPAAFSFFVPRPGSLALAAAILLVTGALAGLYPAWLAARAPIAATLRSEAT